MRKSTLFDLAAQNILANRARFNHLAERTGINPFGNTRKNASQYPAR
jgi:hypothetical protein